MEGLNETWCFHGVSQDLLDIGCHEDGSAFLFAEATPQLWLNLQFLLGVRKQPLLIMIGANTSINLRRWPGSAEHISYSVLHPSKVKHPRFT